MGVCGFYMPSKPLVGGFSKQESPSILFGAAQP